MKVPEIYNTYLSVSRGSRGKPWKARKDFSEFEKTPEWPYCKKLELFFDKFPQINPYEFLRAPYEIYKDEDHFPLNFYTSRKAIAVWSIFQKQKADQSPDTDEQIEDIKKSLKHIALLCFNKGITLDQYCELKESYVCKMFADYNDKLLNPYVLIKLPNFEKQLNSLNLQDKEIYLKDLSKNITKYKMRLNTSIRANSLITAGLKLIKTNNIDKNKN